MKSLANFLENYFKYIVLGLLTVIFFRTCSLNSNDKKVNKRIDALKEEVASLKDTVATRNDLIIEGLKSEKRMIQSTDRKMLDVTRQGAIDEEIKKLESK
jgi:hypothetical protein